MGQRYLITQIQVPHSFLKCNKKLPFDTIARAPPEKEKESLKGTRIESQ
jgi:hypothetical protein